MLSIKMRGYSGVQKICRFRNLCDRIAETVAKIVYSHSIVPGGLEVTS